MIRVLDAPSRRRVKQTGQVAHEILPTLSSDPATTSSSLYRESASPLTSKTAKHRHPQTYTAPAESKTAPHLSLRKRKRKNNPEISFVSKIRKAISLAREQIRM